MSIKETPAGKHRAIPTRGSDTLHDGDYRDHCEACCAIAAELTRQNMPRFEGTVINIGDAVRFTPECRMSFMPEWATITTVRFNSHTGEVWMHAFAAGENLVITDDMIMEVKPWQG